MEIGSKMAAAFKMSEAWSQLLQDWIPLLLGELDFCAEFLKFKEDEFQYTQDLQSTIDDMGKFCLSSFILDSLRVMFDRKSSIHFNFEKSQLAALYILKAKSTQLQREQSNIVEAIGTITEEIVWTARNCSQAQYLCVYRICGVF